MGATEMRIVLDGFWKLTAKQRNKLTKKERESTAELLVSMAVEHHFGLHCEDVEQAVIMHEEALQTNADYLSCTEKLSVMMQELTEVTPSISNGHKSSVPPATDAKI